MKITAEMYLPWHMYKVIVQAGIYNASKVRYLEYTFEKLCYVYALKAWYLALFRNIKRRYHFYRDDGAM